MGKSSPSVPTPPDPVATATAQSTSDVNTAAAQAALNSVNQTTPFGSTSYSVNGQYTTPSGQTVPTYNQTTQLTPLAQSILNNTEGLTIGQQGLQGQQQSLQGTQQYLQGEQQYLQNGQLSTGGTLGQSAASMLPGLFSLGRTAQSAAETPLNFNTADSPTLNSSPQLLDQNAVDAVYGQQKSFLDPQWEQQTQQLQDQLSRQGIPVGSEAYNNAMKQLDTAKTQAYQSAQDSAVASGSQNASQLFNMALQGQQQNVNQQVLGQQDPMNLYGGLLNNITGTLGGETGTFGSLAQMAPVPPVGQVPYQPISTPTATTVAPTDVVGATGLTTNAQNQAYQAQLASNNATAGAEGSVASAAVIAGIIAL